MRPSTPRGSSRAPTRGASSPSRPSCSSLIGAGWLAGSLLSPGNRALGLIPLAPDEARQATRLVFALGIAVSLSFLFSGLSLRWNLPVTTQGTLQVLPVLLGSAVLWRVAALAERTRLKALAEHGASTDDGQTLFSIGIRFVYLAVRLVRLVAIAGPILAMLGFLPAAAFLVIRTALTIGLLGATHVVFDLLNKSVQGLLSSPTAPADDDSSLAPIVVGALVTLAALPILALTWGARPSAIADFWTTMRDGVTLGGIRLSATAVVTLVAVFALGFGLTRLIQTILRGTVLPRTRLDAGGRNAVLAGVGYVGFAISGLAAVSTAGLNLSSLAIVAGALSVGIGFGLQNVVSNFVSGIILLVERPVKEGDWIEVGAFSGYVKGISVRSTEITTFDRASVIVPNSDLIAGTVLNRTHTGMSGRLQVPISTTYDADPRKVEAILIEMAEQHPLILEDPAPRGALPRPRRRHHGLRASLLAPRRQLLALGPLRPQLRDHGAIPAGGHPHPLLRPRDAAGAAAARGGGGRPGPDPARGRNPGLPQGAGAAAGGGARGRVVPQAGLTAAKLAAIYAAPERGLPGRGNAIGKRAVHRRGVRPRGTPASPGPQDAGERRRKTRICSRC